MRLLSFALLSCLTASAIAQDATTRFREAEKVWSAHRADGMTWNDGTPEASQALDVMWVAAIDTAERYIRSHPSATPRQIETSLSHLSLAVAPRTENDLAAKVLFLRPHLYAIAFTDWPAGTVFVLNMSGTGDRVWRMDQAPPQPADKDHLLQAWRSDRAYEKCGDVEPNGLYATCGPVTSTIGLLPEDSSGHPRFYVQASYSKDAGASFAEQTSIWRWEGTQASDLWIDRHIIHTEATRPLRIRGSILSYGVQDDFRTTFACMACDGRELLRRVSIIPTGVNDLGTTVLYPELDKVDDLLLAIAANRPVIKLASPSAIAALRPRVQKIQATHPTDRPDKFFIGMLVEWSVSRINENRESICFMSEDLGGLYFTLTTDGPEKGKLTAVTPFRTNSEHCPTGHALRKPYSLYE